MSESELTSKHKSSCGGVDVELLVEGIRPGLVVARNCTSFPAPPGLAAHIQTTIEGLEETAAVQARFSLIRDMLRFGQFRPTGRNKPASEYLFRAALSRQFPAINNLVDVINLVSLRSQFPISLIDVDRAETSKFCLRRGREQESYVFNAGGQVIDLRDLLLIAALPADSACANPIKDSMKTKLTSDSKNVLAVIYAPVDLADECSAAASELAALFREHGGDRVEVSL